jgi:hypothetical protein
VFIQDKLPPTCPNGNCPGLVSTVNISQTQSTTLLFLQIIQFFTYILGVLSIALIPIGLILGIVLIVNKKGKLWFNILLMASGFILLIMAVLPFTITQVITSLTAGNIAGSFIQ